MSTVINFKSNSNISQPQPSIRVKEPVAVVAKQINDALEKGHRFVALTDAATEKGISISPQTVKDFNEE